jgi:hypothetical protein
MKSLHKSELKLIICGGINIDYLTDNERKKQPDAMLLSYSLVATVHFPTRVQNQSCRAIDKYSLINTNSQSLLPPLYIMNYQIMILNC